MTRLRPAYEPSWDAATRRYFCGGFVIKRLFGRYMAWPLRDDAAMAQLGPFDTLEDAAKAIQDHEDDHA